MIILSHEHETHRLSLHFIPLLSTSLHLYPHFTPLFRNFQPLNTIILKYLRAGGTLCLPFFTSFRSVQYQGPPDLVDLRGMAAQSWARLNIVLRAGLALTRFPTPLHFVSVRPVPRSPGPCGPSRHGRSVVGAFAFRRRLQVNLQHRFNAHFACTQKKSI